MSVFELTTLTDESLIVKLKSLLGERDDLLDHSKRLSDKATEVLAEQKNRRYLSSSLTALTDAQAEELGQFKGGLFLNGLTMLTDKQAEALAKHKNFLSLDGLTTLTDAQAEALAKHEGWLSLAGLTTLSDKAVEVLLANTDVKLPDKFQDW